MISHGNNAVVNGDFEKAGTPDEPKGWRGDWGGKAFYVTEKGNSFVRLSGGVNKNGTGNWTSIEHVDELPVPQKAVRIIISARVRAPSSSIIVSRQVWPCVDVLFNDEKQTHSQLQVRVTKTGVLKNYSQENAIPVGADHFKLELVNGACAGDVDFDDIEVTFK